MLRDVSSCVTARRGVAIVGTSPKDPASALRATVTKRRGAEKGGKGAKRPVARTPIAVLTTLFSLSFLASIGTASAAAAAPVWQMISVANTTALPGGTITFHLEVTNVGSASADGSMVITTITLPAGVTGVSGRGFEPGGFGPLPDCTAGDGVSPVTGASTIQCATTNPVPKRADAGAGATLRYTIVTAVDPAVSIPSTLITSFGVSGGDPSNPTASTVDPTRIGSPPGFGVDAFDGQIEADAAGTPFTQAAGHPYAISTAIDFNTITSSLPMIGDLWPGEPVKDAVVDLPPGLVGSPAAVDQCTAAQLANSSGTEARPLCPATSQVGTTLVRVNGEGAFPTVWGPLPVFNMVPPPDTPAQFGFNVSGTVVTLTTRLRSGTNYGLSVDGSDISEGLAVAGASFTFWGVPSDSSHDDDRGCPGRNPPWSGGPSCPSGAPPRAFLRNPTSCAAPAGSPVQDGLATSLSIDSWDHPGTRNANGEPVSGDPNWQTTTWVTHAPPGYPTPAETYGSHLLPTGCDKVPFNPTLTVTPPPPAQAGEPSGLKVDVASPQNSDPASVDQGDIRRTVVTFPQGVLINPAAAGGLSSCSESEIGFTGVGVNEPNPIHFNTQDLSCPESSKIATAELQTPLLSDPLKGAVYQAAQGENPFGSLLAVYLVVKGSGVTIKLAGEVHVDPATGQISSTFDHTPQAPFSSLHLTFNDGPRAVFTLPPGCGTYTTAAQLESWSGATVSSPSRFTLTEDSEGGCTPPGFSPSFTAGTEISAGGAYSPFLLSFSRGDGEQQISGLQSTLAPGLLARLADVPLCSGADASAGTCPAASQIGTVRVASGAGSNPFFLKGQVYLTGPYNGGPYGEAVVVPAVAGPFNLGNVVVRGSIRIDPRTAQATVVSDPFPQFVGSTGIPTDVRRVDVTLDRPGFMFNPTNCDPFAVSGLLTSVQGVQASVSSRFQAANCATLPFHPSFKVSTQAKTSKANGASLKVNVAFAHSGPQSSSQSGEANIHKVEVALPSVLPSRLTTLQKACTEKQFDVNPAGCPAASNVGTATASTPVLAHPLSGPAYLVSHGGQAFPDLVLVLQGEGIVLHVTGHTQIRKGVTYSRFETVPDAPISSFELKLPEGPYSALAATTPLCGRTVTTSRRVTRRVHGRTVRRVQKVRRHVPASLLMPTTITAQNGAAFHQNSKIAVTGCPAPKAKRHKKAKTGGRGRR